MKFMKEQKYAGTKRILIANEHPSLRVLNDRDDYGDKVIEKHVPNRKSVSLGAIRNQLLTLVPSRAYVMILDDDDYISPMFLTEMINFWHQQLPKAAMVQMGNRLNHNLRTNSSWQSSHPSGFVHFIADIDLLRRSDFKYLNRNSMEDLSIHELSSRTIWHESPPELYIRYIHGDNTSLYIDSQQSLPNTDLREIDVTTAMSQLCEQHAPPEMEQNGEVHHLKSRCRFVTERGFLYTIVLMVVSLLTCILLRRRQGIAIR